MICKCTHDAADHGHPDTDLTPGCKIGGCQCVGYDPLDPGAELHEVATVVTSLLEMGERQMKAVEIWEEIWTQRLPEAAVACKGMADALDELGHQPTPEQASEMAEQLLKIGGLLQSLHIERPPDPNLIVLYYLRRISRQLEEEHGLSF